MLGSGLNTIIDAIRSIPGAGSMAGADSALPQDSQDPGRFADYFKEASALESQSPTSSMASGSSPTGDMQRLATGSGEQSGKPLPVDGEPLPSAILPALEASLEGAEVGARVTAQAPAIPTDARGDEGASSDFASNDVLLTEDTVLPTDAAGFVVSTEPDSSEITGVDGAQILAAVIVPSETALSETTAADSELTKTGSQSTGPMLDALPADPQGAKTGILSMAGATKTEAELSRQLAMAPAVASETAQMTALNADRTDQTMAMIRHHWGVGGASGTASDLPVSSTLGGSAPGQLDTVNRWREAGSTSISPLSAAIDGGVSQAAADRRSAVNPMDAPWVELPTTRPSTGDVGTRTQQRLDPIAAQAVVAAELTSDTDAARAAEPITSAVTPGERSALLRRLAAVPAEAQGPLALSTDDAAPSETRQQLDWTSSTYSATGDAASGGVSQVSSASVANAKAGNTEGGEVATPDSLETIELEALLDELVPDDKPGVDRELGDRSLSAAASRAGDAYAAPLAGTAASTVNSARQTAAASSAELGSQLQDLYESPDAPEFPEALLGRVRMLHANGQREVQLNLHPAELGRLTITVATEGDSARVAFTVDNPQARDAIEQTLPRLRELLDEAGLQLADSSVSDQRAGGDELRREIADQQQLAGRSGEHDEGAMSTEPEQTEPAASASDALFDAYA